jgi:2-polyprenyl-3-methyl-5-hydroxy-6-metoxy-1,4-benzoquinol methylase
MQKIIELRDLIKSRNDPELNAYLETLEDLLNPELQELKKLLESENWPVAVDPSLICDPSSESDKLIRAEGIIALLIDENLENKKFLDFGCGEGHVPFIAAEQNLVLSVGYDIKDSPSWNQLKNNNLILTTNIEIVKKNAPYDVVLIYDVLDHLEQSNTIEILTQLKDLLSNTGKIYLRTHPFCSRHATHLYHKINKAFIHLIFTNDELEKLGYEITPNANIVFPLATYSKLIKEANLKILKSNEIRETVEDFFKDTPIIKKRIKEIIPNNNDDFPDWQCEQQFLDYILE